MALEDVVIVSAVRTPIGRFQGSLSDFTAPQLGAIVVREAVRRAGIDPNIVDECIMGNVVQAGLGQNPARQAALNGGLADRVSATTINKVCGSGLKAVGLAAQAIQTGNAEIVVAGGMESMTNAPYLLMNARKGFRLGDQKVVDAMVHDGLWDVYNDYHMGVTAENVARQYGISRQDQDEFAAASQQKAFAAQKEGRFKEEIVPIEVAQRKGTLSFDSDEYIRPGSTAALLSELKPAFSKDGTVTAGNASGINDGAAAVMMMSARRAQELGLKPLAFVRAYSCAGVDPKVMGMGPVPASRLCLEKAGWTVQDLDLLEVNEAFAAQAIAVNRQMGWDTRNINVNGGAIAIGHPIGASGCRILVTLLHEMIRRDAKKGLASLCIGGGMGVALAVER